MKILFLGDSITSSHRDTENPDSLGEGYVSILAMKVKPMLWENKPVLCNRGVGGDTTSDVLARFEKDVVAEKPDFVCLMIGINDVWSHYREKEDEDFDFDAFENNYKTIVEKIKALGAKLVIMQPYLLSVPDKRRMRRTFEGVLDIIEKIALENADEYIPFDEMLNGLTAMGGISVSAYSIDGVHPTHRACRLIADNLILKLKKYIN